MESKKIKITGSPYDLSSLKKPNKNIKYTKATESATSKAHYDLSFVQKSTLKRNY